VHNIILTFSLFYFLITRTILRVKLVNCIQFITLRVVHFYFCNFKLCFSELPWPESFAYPLFSVTNYVTHLISRTRTRRYTCSMQLEIKQREKMKRRRALQLMLFLKVSLIIGLVAGCEVASRVWKIPFLWAVFCTGHSLQVCRGKICGKKHIRTISTYVGEIRDAKRALEAEDSPRCHFTPSSPFLTMYRIVRP